LQRWAPHATGIHDANQKEANVNFSAHNIRFSNGIETKPEVGYLISESSTCQASMRTLKLALGEKLRNKSIVDLGCLEGGYTAEFARAGMEALGIEARQSNLDNCEIVRTNLRLSNLKFAKDDVMNIDNYKIFDASYCNGLLYHLDKPREFVEKLSSRTRRVTLIHTHVALEELGPTFSQLSEMTENEGLRGRWYAEHSAVTEEEAEKHIWSSWKNNRSFWPTKPALLQLLTEVGFDCVFEQFDWINNISDAMTTGGYSPMQRVMLVGIKTAQA
jgi:SAM-dependent methyltransferase